jgi:hypothetical protein
MKIINLLSNFINLLFLFFFKVCQSKLKLCPYLIGKNIIGVNLLILMEKDSNNSKIDSEASKLYKKSARLIFDDNEKCID